MYLSDCNTYFTGNSTFSTNFGALLAIYSNISFSGWAIFINNSQPPTPTTLNFQDGGALSLFQTNAKFDGTCIFKNNQAENGGALHAVESELVVSGNLSIKLNSARGSGGGIYLSQSDLNVHKLAYLTVASNTAHFSGGGIQAESSTIQSTSADETNLIFLDNSAEKGGGIHLETIYVHKLAPFDGKKLAVHFIHNTANHGGAVYVNDRTNSATCTIKGSECFFRVVFESYIIVTPNIPTIYFADNYANMSGSSLYGGLLDRCTVSPFAKVNIYAIDAYRLDIDGALYFYDVSVGTNSTSISSLPVRLCLCMNNQSQCDYESFKSVSVMKGEAIYVSIIAVDQIGNPVSAGVQSILKYNSSGLGEGQLMRSIPAKCTQLKINIISPHEDEVLMLYASNGPCGNEQQSTLHLDISFLPCICPLGFQPNTVLSQDNCTCECHDDIRSYVTCDPMSNSLFKKPHSNVWLSYTNNTKSQGFLIYPNCPSIYCKNRQGVIINFEGNSSDTQCAFNRLGTLCGSCKKGLSLSIGRGNYCLVCPKYWPLVFILVSAAAMVSGVLLSAIFLALNMTVAVGTLNGFIFYANIVGFSGSVLIPMREQSFLTVVISWLNFKVGFEACYIVGLDMYAKVWIQLGYIFTYLAFCCVLIVLVKNSVHV